MSDQEEKKKAQRDEIHNDGAYAPTDLKTVMYEGPQAGGKGRKLQ